jgi:hypothetical protein
MEILGWIANAFFFSGGLFKNPRLTIANYALADGLYVIMYFSAGLWVAAISMLFAGIRSGLSLFLNEKQNKISVIVFTLIVSIIVIFNMKHNADILILLAGCCIGLSCYYRDSIIPFRISTSVSQILWIFHSLIFGVYPMVFCCCIILVTNIYALLVYTDLFKGFDSKLLSPKNA